MPLLIFEPEEIGHRANYFNAFIRHAAAHPETGEVIYALSEKLFLRLEPNTLQELSASDGRLRVRLLTEPEIQFVERSAMEVRSNFNRWRLALKIAAEETAGRILFPLLDDVMKAAAIMPVTRFEISGIYFRPTTHFAEYRKGPVGLTRQAAKALLVKRFLDRGDSKSLSSFDPWFTDFAQSAYSNGAKVRTVPEPIDVPGADKPPRANGAIRFLFFGALQKRKGVAEFIGAFKYLNPDYRSMAEFSICGEGELSSLIRQALPEIKARGWKINFEQGFLPEPVLMERLKAADAILAPYRDHIGSSGALYVAAGLRCPVITQATGLLGRQVTKYRLGEAIDTGNPEQIARAIEQTTDRLFSNASNVDADYEGFSAGHGSEAFAQAIYEHS
ncbi:MAG TPA: glycosyltransferase [Rhizomicrobium sp.]|nr:glycosyltransferase [Rhizomicrobium sp.]